MHPYLRAGSVVLRSFTQPRCHPLDEARLPMRVWPTDVEVARMNNGRLVTLMDLGRLDLTFRCGLLAQMVKRRWFPLVASLTVRYRRSLHLGQRYELVSRLAGFDAKWWFMDQRFEVAGQVVAQAYIKGVFRGPGGNVPTSDLLLAAGHPGVASPPLSEGFRAWLASEEIMRAEGRRLGAPN